MYRLLAIDLDGTLLTPPPHKIITTRTRELVVQAVEAGIALVIATGQTRSVLRHVCAGLPLTGPQIIENGAVIVDGESGTILHERLLPGDVILPVLAALHDNGLYRAYHTHDRVYIDRNTPRASTWYRPPLDPPTEVEDVARLYPMPCIKIAGVGEQETLVEKRIALAHLFEGRVYVTQSAYDLLEFLHPAVSKGNALKTIAADLGISRQEIIAIGDNHNDLGMITFAGLGVAMGNAPGEVKEAADYVTLSNTEEGVAAVIERYVLR